MLEGVGILWTEVIIVALNSPWSFACLEESIIISRNETGMPTWKKKFGLKVLQLFIYGCMNKLIGVRDRILEKWCDGTLFPLWWRSDHAHQLWLWVDLNNPG